MSSANPSVIRGEPQASILSRGCGACALALLALSCVSHGVRTEEALDDFRRGHLSKAIEAYGDTHTTGSAFLSGAEAGTVALAGGQWDEAIKHFNRAHKVVEGFERSAVISPESLGEMLLTWTLSESAAAYRGEGYERVMVHMGLAMAFLAKGNLVDAQVEIRRSNSLLESEEKLYEKEYQAGGLGHFISAVAYELDGQPDEAYIDYKRMEAKGVGTELAGRALVRLATQLHNEDDLRLWTEKYGADIDRPEDSASVVIIAGIGLGPYKLETTLTIPTEDGLLQWSVPGYIRRPQTVDDLELSVAGGDRGVRTVAVEDVGRVASENLQDRLAWLAAKSAVRAVIKRELTKSLEEGAGIWGRLLGDLFTLATEHADLRSLQTLPDSWQAARVFLPAGAHEISLGARGGETRRLGTFELVKGETMFILARSVGSTLYAFPIGGRRIDAGSRPEASAMQPKSHETPGAP